MTNHTETEHIEIIPDALPRGLQWEPIIGEETQRLMERLAAELDDTQARHQIEQSGASFQ
jgi:hypothetical protein